VAKFNYAVIMVPSTDLEEIERECKSIGSQGFRLVTATREGNVTTLYFEHAT
jgi:hypothetical protein